MAELTTEQRIKLIDLCKQRVAANGIADVCDVAKDHGGDIGCDGIDFWEAERVAHLLCANDRRYDLHKVGDHSYDIFLNKNYEIEESVKQTNENVRKTNSKTWVIAALAAIFALGSFLTPIVKSDKSQQEQWKQINILLQRQEQSLDRIEQSLKEINASIRTKKSDTVLVRSVTPKKP